MPSCTRPVPYPPLRPRRPAHGVSCQPCRAPAPTYIPSPSPRLLPLPNPSRRYRLLTRDTLVGGVTGANGTSDGEAGWVLATGVTLDPASTPCPQPGAWNCTEAAQVEVGGLQPGAFYRLRVRGMDVTGSLGRVAAWTWVTAGCIDPARATISVSTVDAMDYGVRVVTWTPSGSVVVGSSVQGCVGTWLPRACVRQCVVCGGCVLGGGGERGGG